MMIYFIKFVKINFIMNVFLNVKNKVPAASLTDAHQKKPLLLRKHPKRPFTTWAQRSDLVLLYFRKIDQMY